MTQAAPTITARDAQRSVRAFVAAHNAASYTHIRTSIRDGQLAVSLKQRRATWFTVTNLAQVGAFADAVTDHETGCTGRTYDSDCEQGAYDFALGHMNSCASEHVASSCHGGR